MPGFAPNSPFVEYIDFLQPYLGLVAKAPDLRSALIRISDGIGRDDATWFW
jgi:hypothetical protein